jgi:hypothetical protein
MFGMSAGTTTRETTMKTVSEIMESAGIIITPRPYGRAAAMAAIEALREVAGFREVAWTDSFCHGRYTSPSARWTAEDSTGRVQISWSVNAATGEDNGYRVSQDSHWDAETKREKAKRQERNVAWAKYCASKRSEADRDADWVQGQADELIHSAFEHIANAANARRARGDIPEYLHQLALAALDRKGAAHYLTRASWYRAKSAQYSRQG